MAATRRLAAIMFTDMVGSTAMAQANEELALRLRDEQEELVRPLFAAYQGRAIKSMGDGFLAEFDSALRAVQCAIDIQQRLHERNSRKGHPPINLRIGIHLGDVEVRGSDIFGDSVNVASRIEPLAESGGICVTEPVFGQVRNKIPNKLEKLPPKVLKNVSFPVDVYRVLMPWEPTGTSPPTLSDQNRIAVLPFANMSPDPADEYFADGMTEELIDRLAQVKRLTIIARTSVMSYKKKEKKASEIAQELAVGTLVEGSVRKAGNRVRITVQLISGRTEGHLWSAHFDRDLDDIFAIQSEIAEKVAGELDVRLLDSERTTLVRKPTENTEAYSHFLRGRELYRQGTDASIRQALALFSKAIELDPSFARAHVGVAECHQRLAEVGYEGWDDSLRNVKASLKRALELDPNLPELHTSLSELAYNEDDAPRAEEEARKALELNPSLPHSYYLLAELAGIKGEPEEMVTLREAAYRLDPIMPSYIKQVGDAYLGTGREEKALELWKKTEQVDPRQISMARAEYYLAKGNLEKAREFYAMRERLPPTTSPWLTWMGGSIAAQSGDRESALIAIKKIEDLNLGPIGLNYTGFVYHALGDLDSYFDYMNRAIDVHTLIPMPVLYSPLFARARADPRYPGLVEKLRRRIGLLDSNRPG